jgi:hypothetical protein
MKTPEADRAFFDDGPHDLYPPGHTLRSALTEGLFQGDYCEAGRHNWLLKWGGAPDGDIFLKSCKSLAPNVLELRIENIGTLIHMGATEDLQYHNWFDALRPGVPFDLVCMNHAGTAQEQVQCTVVEVDVTTPDPAVAVARVQVTLGGK